MHTKATVLILAAVVWLGGCALPGEGRKIQSSPKVLVAFGYGKTVRSDVVRIPRVTEGWSGDRLRLEMEVENLQLAPLMIDLDVVFRDASGKKLENPWGPQPLLLKARGVRVVRVTAPSIEAVSYTVRLLRSGPPRGSRGPAPAPES